LHILVTGGAGYIGSHTCKALAASGWNPVTLDSLITGHEWAVQWGPFEKGDIRDTAFVAGVMRKYDIRAVVHFAALSLVGESTREPWLYYDNNVSGTLSLLKAMTECGITRIVFSSTCAVYGVPPALPISEDMPRLPINTYGRSKLGAENAILDMAEAGRLSAVILRYFNAAGADEDLAIGEAHVHESHLIPLAIRAARLQSTPLSIFGTDYDTPDGTCLRDYIHVSDLAAAHLAAIRFLDTNNGGHCFNVGTGLPVSVRSVLNAVGAAMKTKVPVIEAPRRPGDPAALFAATQLAAKGLGWTPRYLDIADIVAGAVAWDAKYAAGAGH
jgi:UDP-arabinose 4-epimerase